ncbi:hypothetical protein PMAYCL1PPCAC_26781, partial [Pristionchus mayeri]
RIRPRDLTVLSLSPLPSRLQSLTAVTEACEVTRTYPSLPRPLSSGRFAVCFSDPGVFTTPNHMSNVILKIDSMDVHVSKEYLAIHSPVFYAMFFTEDNVEDGEEIELEDIIYEDSLSRFPFHVLLRR